MSEKEAFEWTEWKYHRGTRCPVRMGEIVQSYDVKGKFNEGRNNCPIGTMFGPWGPSVLFYVLPRSSTNGQRRIARYRVRKPRALVVLRDIARTVRVNAPTGEE